MYCIRAYTYGITGSTGLYPIMNRPGVTKAFRLSVVSLELPVTCIKLLM